MHEEGHRALFPLLSNYMKDQVCMPTGGVAHTQFPEEVPGLSDTHKQDPGHGDVSVSLDARPAASRRFLFVAAEFCCDVHL